MNRQAPPMDVSRGLQTRRATEVTIDNKRLAAASPVSYWQVNMTDPEVLLQKSCFASRRCGWNYGLRIGRSGGKASGWPIGRLLQGLWRWMRDTTQNTGARKIWRPAKRFSLAANHQPIEHGNETSPEGVQRHLANVESSTSNACPIRRRRMMYLRQPCKVSGLSLAQRLGHT